MHKIKPWLRFIEGEEGGQATQDAVDEAEGTEGETTDGDIDWKAKFEAEREHSRKWEQRAKSNKDATDKLKQLEDADKSELDRAREELETERSRAVEAAREVLRYKVAAANGLTAEDAELFLTADDEDGMTAQAKRLSELADSKKAKRGAGVPDGSRDRTPPAPTLKSGADLYDRVKSNLY